MGSVAVLCCVTLLWSDVLILHTSTATNWWKWWARHHRNTYFWGCFAASGTVLLKCIRHSNLHSSRQGCRKHVASYTDALGCLQYCCWFLHRTQEVWSSLFHVIPIKKEKKMCDVLRIMLTASMSIFLTEETFCMGDNWTLCLWLSPLVTGRLRHPLLASGTSDPASSPLTHLSIARYSRTCSQLETAGPWLAGQACDTLTTQRSDNCVNVAC